MKNNLQIAISLSLIHILGVNCLGTGTTVPKVIEAKGNVKLSTVGLCLETLIVNENLKFKNLLFTGPNATILHVDVDPLGLELNQTVTNPKLRYDKLEAVGEVFANNVTILGIPLNGAGIFKLTFENLVVGSKTLDIIIGKIQPSPVTLVKYYDEYTHTDGLRGHVDGVDNVSYVNKKLQSSDTLDMYNKKAAPYFEKHQQPLLDVINGMLNATFDDTKLCPEVLPVKIKLVSLS